MDSFYAPPEHISGSRVLLTGEEFSHLAHVMRHREGDRIVVVDGAGIAYGAVIREIARREAHCEVVEAYPEMHEPGVRVVLGAALLKNPSRYDTLVEKACEIGVRAIVPLETDRTIPRSPRIDRWKKIALSAMKQSGRCRLVEIHPPTTLGGFAEAQSAADLRLIAHEKPQGETVQGIPTGEWQSAACCIGPEGGFTDGEIALASSAGFRTALLGPRRLRAETAAVALLALLLLPSPVIRDSSGSG